MKVSVVIPAHNEEKLLGSCLESLCRQTTRVPFEVILVDNNSTDNTDKVAKSFCSQINITIISEKEKGRGRARACGFARAQGEIIFSTDADTIVPSDWIESMLAYFDDPKVVAVAGKVVVKDLSWFYNHLFRMWQKMGEVGYRIAFGHWWLGGYSFAIRKDVYEKAGGFNKIMDALEDVDLSMRVRFHGKIKQAENKAIFSGRRYKSGFLKGGSIYLKTFGKYLYKRNTRIELPDVRD